MTRIVYENGVYWGITGNISTRIKPQDNNLRPIYRMKVLELFSGTGSVSKICEEYGFDCISVDITDKLHPVDIKTDILTWDYKNRFKPGDFDIIWASPPCSSFSTMVNLSKTKDKIILGMEKNGLPPLYKTREIIDYFKPEYYFIENPRGGRMKNYITDLPYHDISYCRYGFDYQKHTRIWTNLDSFTPRFCGKKTGYCENRKISKTHKAQVGITRKIATAKFKANGTNPSLEIKYRIPPNLIRSIFDSV